MYQRIGKVAFKKDLTNIIKLCDALGNPQDGFKSIHIAGTNGKGSTCHALSAIYQNNGYKVGLYTSPHLLDFRERIRIDGLMCSESFVIDFVAKNSNLIEEIKPSFFEITVAMAFTYFNENAVDVAIIETGLGGRLDSTNILNPIATGITSIGFDHMDMLGDTIEKIATEKAGIIKENTPIVLGDIQSQAREVIVEIARQKNAAIHDFIIGSFRTDLKGSIQQINLGFALEMAAVLGDILPTELEKNLEAILDVKGLTGMQGRWQIISENPLIICDVAHNLDGIQLLINDINKQNLNAYFVLGFVSDKSLDNIVHLFPKENNYYFVQPSVVRGRDAASVKLDFENTHKNVSSYESLLQAVVAATAEIRNESNAAIVVSGSNFLVADMLHLKQQNKLPF